MRLINREWKRRLARTNVEGLSNLVRFDSSIYQLAWFSVYLLSSLLTVYLIAQSLLKYMKCQVNTTVRRKTVGELDFPKVTFCARNPLDSDSFLDMLNKTNATLEDDQYYVLLKFESYMKNKSGRYLSLAEKQNMSDLERMIVSCTFRSKACSFAEDFVAIFDSYWLNCVRFNSGIDSTSGRPIASKKVFSASDELSVEFDVGLPDPLAFFYPDKMLVVWIHDFASNFIRLPDNGLKLTAGFEVALQAAPFVYKQFNEWPFAYSECTVDEANALLKPLANANIFERLTRVEHIKYTRESCLNVCFQQLLAEHCGCIDFWPNVTIGGYDYCLDARAECSYEFYYNVFATEDFVTRNCIDLCPAECVTRGFSTQLSYKKINDDASNVLRLSIRYASLAYKETLEEARMSWKSLLGEFGGHLHIFLGVSLISFVEIFGLVTACHLTKRSFR